MENMNQFTVHPLCGIIPAPDAEDYARLAVDIKANGLLEPITLYEGKVLDGRSRYRACQELGVAPRFGEYPGADPLGFVLAKNLSRRHLTASQKAMVAGRVANIEHGGDRRSEDFKGLNSPLKVSTADAADRLGIGERIVKDAKAVLASGDADLITRVERGELAVDKAAAQARGARRLTGAARTGAPGRKGEVITVAEWKRLPIKQREVALATVGQAKFNAQQTLDIEWARWSWNPVTGCEHDCVYCYARDIAETLYLTKFAPALWPGSITASRNTSVPKDKAEEDPSYRNVFLCSMADLFGRWVPREWIDRILREAGDNSQWNFLCLTKNPQRVADFVFPDNVWIGTTVDRQERVRGAEEAFIKVRCKTKWLSCEPLLAPLRFSRMNVFQWVVIGGASRSERTSAWRPPMDWLVGVHVQARKAGLRIYYKTNAGLEDGTRIREFPWVEPRLKELPKEFCCLAGGKRNGNPAG